MLTIYGIITFLVPIATAVGIVWKIFSSTKKAVGDWANAQADRLIGNHATHIQAAVEQSAKSLVDVATSNREIANTMVEMRKDFHESQKEVRLKQEDILTGIEIVKAKVN